MEREHYVRLTGDRRTSDAALWLAPGATKAEAMAAIRALPGSGALDIGEPGEIREVSLAIFDRSFAVTYALEAVAVLVGLFGLSSSIGAMGGAAIAARAASRTAGCSGGRSSRSRSAAWRTAGSDGT